MYQCGRTVTYIMVFSIALKVWFSVFKDSWSNKGGDVIVTRQTFVIYKCVYFIKAVIVCIMCVQKRLSVSHCVTPVVFRQQWWTDATTQSTSSRQASRETPVPEMTLRLTQSSLRITQSSHLLFCLDFFLFNPTYFLLISFFLFSPSSIPSVFLFSFYSSPPPQDRSVDLRLETALIFASACPAGLLIWSL